MYIYLGEIFGISEPGFKEFPLCHVVVYPKPQALTERVVLAVCDNAANIYWGVHGYHVLAALGSFRPGSAASSTQLV